MYLADPSESPTLATGRSISRTLPRGTPFRSGSAPQQILLAGDPHTRLSSELHPDGTGRVVPDTGPVCTICGTSCQDPRSPRYPERDGQSTAAARSMPCVADCARVGLVKGVIMPQLKSDGLVLEGNPLYEARLGLAISGAILDDLDRCVPK